MITVHPFQINYSVLKHEKGNRPGELWVEGHQGYNSPGYTVNLKIVRSYHQNAKNELSLGKIQYLWHRRFMQVQLKSLHNISEIFSMKTNHIFGYTRLVAPEERWENQEFLNNWT